MCKVVIITGGSSGIGLETARYLAQKNCIVYECSRREHTEDNIHHVRMDVTDSTGIDEAVRGIMEKEGRIDVLINNAGFGISGAIEFTDIDDAKRLLDVNFYGMVRMTKAVLPYMRSQGFGRIVNISSVAAPIAIPFQAYYSVSKAAINAFSLALANEVRPFGIVVCGIMPGDIQSGFTSKREKIHWGDDVYGGRISKSVAVMEKDEQNGMNPKIAGRFIGNVALSNRNKVMYTLGVTYKAAVLIFKLLPTSLANKIVGKLYA
ncbi:MAG TPA: short-chain dehydrogenase [Clostridiales bacterium]|nr:short-chain dehydrogenase [Clostridiales bacterium]